MVMAESESALIDLHFNKSYQSPLTDIPPLSVKLLARELSDVDDWYQLCTDLGVFPKQLGEIRESSPVWGDRRVEDCHVTGLDGLQA